jgi:acyl carrier protein
MMNNPAGVVQDKDTIYLTITNLLKKVTQDWDTAYEGEYGPQTKLGSDLGFESIDVVQLVVAIEETYHRRDLPFECLLMKDGRYVDEIDIEGIVDFLDKHINKN